MPPLLLPVPPSPARGAEHRARRASSHCRCRRRGHCRSLCCSRTRRTCITKTAAASTNIATRGCALRTIATSFILDKILGFRRLRGVHWAGARGRPPSYLFSDAEQDLHALSLYPRRSNATHLRYGRKIPTEMGILGAGAESEALVLGVSGATATEANRRGMSLSLRGSRVLVREERLGAPAIDAEVFVAPEHAALGARIVRRVDLVDHDRGLSDEEAVREARRAPTAACGCRSRASRRPICRTWASRGGCRPPRRRPRPRGRVTSFPWPLGSW